MIVSKTWKFGVVGIVFFFLLGTTLLLNRQCAYTPDSAEYIILAESIFSGQGYRDLSEIRRPVHVKHPFLYPLLLALPVGLFPEAPILTAKVVTILLALGGMGLFYLLLRRCWRPSAALGLVGVLAVHPLYLLFAVEPMAETAYLFFSLAAVWLILVAGRSRRLLPALTAGAAIGLAAWTRTIGVALIPAALIFFAFRREWKKGLIVAGVGLICLAAWAGRDHLRERGEGEISYESYGRQFFTSELNPLAEGFSPLRLLPRAYHNAVFYFRAAPYLSFPPVFLNETGLATSIRAPFLLRLQGAGWPKVVVRWLFYLLILPGLFLALRHPKGRISALYALAYIALLLLFPFREYRLIYPLLPFFLGFLFRGLIAAYRRLRFIRFGGVQLVLSLAVVGYLMVDLALISANLGRHRVYRRQAEEGGWEDYPQQLADWGGAGAWLRANTSPDAQVVGGRKELYLLSRRQMVFEGQYGAVLGAFEQALAAPGVKYLVSETTSGLPAAHRMMAHAGEYDFELARRLAGINIYRVRRFPGRTREVPPPDYTRVMAAARRRAAKFPYSFEAHNELGYLAFKTRDYPAAIESFESALRLNPDAGMTRFNLAAAYLDSGEPGPAARELKRCLMMPHADLLFDLVRVNLKIAELQISIEADPLYPENYLRLLEVAGLYYSQKEYTQALRYIDRSLALNPRFADAYFLQGLCQEARGKREEARFAYWTALRCNPAFYPARTQLEALKASNPDPEKNIEE